LKGLVRQVGGMNYVAVREEQADYKVKTVQAENIDFVEAGLQDEE
jgi:hypothetical protein